MLSDYDKKLTELLDTVFQDTQVPDDIRRQLYQIMNDIEDEKNATSIYCLKIKDILTNYFIGHQSNNPESLKELYCFVLSRAERYKEWGVGLAASSLWRLF